MAGTGWSRIARERFNAIIGAIALLLPVAQSGAAESMPLHVVYEKAAEPMSFVGPDGVPTGFAVELFRTVTALAGLPVKESTTTWQDLLARFRNGEFPVIANVAFSEDRAQFIEFSVPHLTLSGGIFTRKGDKPVRTRADLAGLRFAVQPDSYSHVYLRANGWDQNLELVEDFHAAFRALEEGRCDAVAATRIVGVHVVRNGGYRNIAISDLVLDDYSFSLHFGVQRGDARLLARLNAGLARAHANGSYDTLYQRWIGPLDPRPLRYEDVRPVLVPITIVVACVAAAFFWQRRLLKKISLQADQLRLSEERLQHVLDGSEDGFWDWDMTTGELHRSPRWATMLGYTPEEIGSSIGAGTALVHPEDLPLYHEWQKRIRSTTNERLDIEYRMRAKSGEWRWILDRGKVVARAPDGRPLRMSGTHTDITRRKEAETALSEGEARLRRAAQLLEQTQAAARVGGWETDLRTNRVHWTLETHRLYGTDPATYVPTREAVFDFCTPESRKRLVSAVTNTIRDGTPYAIEIEIKNAQGRPMHLHLRAAAEKENGRVIKLAGFVRDITAERTADQEREQLRQKMLEAQKLESLGVLAGGVAHDFNNLLTVVLANASFMRESAPGDKRLAQIETAARRAADLCRQMLAYAGKGRFELEHVDLSAIARDTANLVRVSIGRNANLVIELNESVPQVEADVSQLRQVVMNLVTNAAEALGENSGEIRVATRRARPEPAPGGLSLSFDLPPGDCVCLEISDTGQGMAPATLARIFDPFFTTKFAGRGLGLAAVLGIVRAHRGALTVDSKPGAGTRFRIYLAAVRRPGMTTPPFETTKKAPAARQSGVVLVADDESIVLETAAALLRHRGFETVLATDGHDAVRQFRATPDRFKAVLLDLTMPGLDGAEALRAIRTQNATVPALVMSGFSEESVLERLKGVGRVGILRKPFTADSFIESVTTALDS